MSSNVLEKPLFCQYTSGACDQDFSGIKPARVFFVYPSEPQHIANTFSEVARQLKENGRDQFITWQQLPIAGRIIFCEICKALRSASKIMADITTLNFNVLFEIGYAIGLGKKVIPVRDTTFEKDKKFLEELGIFDVLGYENFQNSTQLKHLALSSPNPSPIILRQLEINRSQPIYYVRSPIDTDGSIKLLSCLKKCYFRFRTFDSRETPRLSLHDAYMQVNSSLSVVAHLMDPSRSMSIVHNARCAFICGLAMASQKHVLILQEGKTSQPIDYRDVVVPYDDPNRIPRIIEPLIRATADGYQTVLPVKQVGPTGLLERLDLGDVAAENEIQALNRYFVKTPQYHTASQGHARLIVGRKGSGKTALFYGLRSKFKQGRDKLVLDLKPEGHQFIKLREVVLKNVSEGLQLHTLTAFWNYLLLLELAKKLLDNDRNIAFSDQEMLASYRALESVYTTHAGISEGDFSERVMYLVDRVIAQFGLESELITSSDITAAIYQSDIQNLNNKLADYLTSRTQIWLIIDNLDKGWPSLGAKSEDIALIRCLLDATRKLQHWFENQQLDFRAIVFIRKDIYDFLIDQTPDRGKESVANLDWSDPELIKELLRLRFSTVPELKGSFDEIWLQLFDTHVGGENSFNYILNRTFMRPRDILNFIRKCIETAVSRGHKRVEQVDFQTAEVGFSEDMLNDIKYEIRDVFPNHPELVQVFMAQPERLSKTDISVLLLEAQVQEAEIEKVIENLLWFSFIGIIHNAEENYSYQMMYNMSKLKVLLKGAKEEALAFCIHPAFRLALQLK